VYLLLSFLTCRREFIFNYLRLFLGASRILAYSLGPFSILRQIAITLLLQSTMGFVTCWYPPSGVQYIGQFVQIVFCIVLGVHCSPSPNPHPTTTPRADPRGLDGRQKLAAIMCGPTSPLHPSAFPSQGTASWAHSPLLWVSSMGFVCQWYVNLFLNFRALGV
jgi:hypothetical protein